MTEITLVIAVLAASVALLSNPGRALAVYCATLVLYPQPLTLQIGPADFSVSRICILAVLANAVVRARRHRSFVWAWTDVCVLGAWALGFVALLQTFPAVAPERHAGVFFDTILPYTAARLIVTSPQELVTLIKSLALFTLPIVVLAIAQMLSGTNPVGFLAEYYAFGLKGDRFEHPQVRLGLYRAAVTFSHPISLGLYCALVAILTLSFWNHRIWPRGAVAAMVAIAGVGLFTSLSSGPLLAVVGAGIVFVVYADWRLATALTGLAVVSIVSIAAYSGEPYTDVLSDFAYNPLTAQFRFDLVREAMYGGMSGHWWTGYGYVGGGPGTDNTGFHWINYDIVNLYLQMLVRTGLLGLIPFLLANVFYYVRLIQALCIAKTPEVTWTAWCVLAAMVGWNLAMLTTSPLTGILQLLYLSIAIATNMPVIVTARRPRAS